MTVDQALDPALRDRVAELGTALLSEGATIGSMYGFTPEECEAVYSLGFAYYNQGKYEAAQKAFSFLTFYNHLERRYFKALGACQQMLRRYDEAVTTYGITVMLDVDDPEPMFHMAECLLAKGLLEDGRAALGHAIDGAAGNPAYDRLAERARAMLALLPAEVPHG